MKDKKKKDEHIKQKAKSSKTKWEIGHFDKSLKEERKDRRIRQQGCARREECD